MSCRTHSHTRLYLSLSHSPGLCVYRVFSISSEFDFKIVTNLWCAPGHLYTHIYYCIWNSMWTESAMQRYTIESHKNADELQKKHKSPYNTISSMPLPFMVSVNTFAWRLECERKITFTHQIIGWSLLFFTVKWVKRYSRTHDNDTR